MITNYQSGHDAEKRAAEYLKANGYTIDELNWKTKYCEIDIVARKQKSVYFVEVKSRKNSYQGTGFDYITPKKLQQMKYAAASWVAHNRWEGDYQLAAISMVGETIEFIDQIDG